MSPIEYREFCESTYCAPAHVNRADYLRLLLIEEVGEVASLFAKALRDGHEVDRGRLLKELGDVMWAATMLQPQSEIHRSTEWLIQWDHPATACSIMRWLPSSAWPFLTAQRLCVQCSFTSEEVALANVAKLQDRQARGVLHGAGDER